MMHGKTEGIIFDVDGVLFDSEPLHLKAWLFTADKMGFHLSKEDLFRWTGLPCEELALYIEKRELLKYSAREVFKVKDRFYRKLLENELEFDIEIKRYLKKFAKKLSLAWATTSSRENIKIMFEKADVFDFFKCGICLEDVTKTKPDPEAYLKAAECLNLVPENCIALDDSQAGISSAVNAGVRTFGITGVFGKEELAGAEKIFDSTTDALRWIEKNIFQQE